MSEKLSEDDLATCLDSVRWVSMVRDHELSEHDKARLEHHLKICARCQVASLQFAKLYAALDSLLAPLPVGLQNTGGAVAATDGDASNT